MNFQELGIDERLLEGAPALRDQAPFHEKMLAHALKGENVCARITMARGREAVFLLPALQWLAASAGPAARILCILPDDAQAGKLAQEASRLGSGIGLRACVASLPSPAEGPVLEGDPSAPFLAGSVGAILASQGLINLKDFGFLLVDGGEAIAELPSESLHHLQAALRPAWERKTIVVCGKVSVKAKNLAWDLSDNPVEIHIEGEAAVAQSVSHETWHIASEAKLSFLLGLIARLQPKRLCVFCNLKPAAEELALRLRFNGVEADYILGSLAPGRKAEIVAALEEEPGSVLVLTDDGALGLVAGRFPLVVNYDLPLDPEYYVRRLEMLDRASTPGLVVNLACDRYVYGIPAIEQYTDSSLDARTVPEELLRAEDKSLDMVYEGAEASEGGARRGHRAGRLVPARPVIRPEGEARREGPRPQERSQGGRDQSRAGRDRDRDRRPGPDRSPDIRKSISDITGGNLDFDAEMPGQAKAPDKGRGPSQGQPGPKGGKGQDGRRRDGRPASKGRDQSKGQRKDQGRGQAGRSQATRSQAANPPGEAQGNPYELSMEERMAAYRRKYSADDAKAGPRPQGRSQGQKKGGQGRGGQGAASAKAGREGQARKDGQGSGQRRSQGQAPRGGQSQGQGQRPAQAAKPSPAAPKPKGFLERLLGLGKRKPS